MGWAVSPAMTETPLPVEFDPETLAAARGWEVEARQAPHRIRGAVGCTHELCVARQMLFPGRGNRVHDEHALHSGSQENTSCERSNG